MEKYVTSNRCNIGKSDLPGKYVCPRLKSHRPKGIHTYEANHECLCYS